MKKLYTSIIVILMMSLFAVSCNKPTGNENTDNNSSEEEKLFAENENGLLLISNNSAEDFVLFYDLVTSSNLIGGLRGGKIKHRVQLPKEGNCIIYAVKYEDYKKTTSLSSLKIVDAELIFYSNSTESTCEISSEYYGDCEIRFSNETNYYIEVGNGSLNSEDIFFAIKPMSTSSAFVKFKAEGYKLYYNAYIPIKTNGEIIGVKKMYLTSLSDLWVPTPEQIIFITIPENAINDADY